VDTLRPTRTIPSVKFERGWFNQKTLTEGETMKLLFQLLRFLALLALNLLLSLIAVLLRLLFLPFLWATLRILLALISLSFTATVNNPRQYIDRLAGEWTQRLLDLGVHREYLDQIHSLCRFLAVSTILLGWVVATIFTVAILRVVFGYFI
jgi:hypothetical protein